jgi:uncharacterized membrane protein YfcA
MQIYWVSMLAAFGAGFVNAVAGGGTLLTFPALLYSGLSSITANATSTVAIWPGSVTSSWAYRQELKANRTAAEYARNGFPLHRALLDSASLRVANAQ